MAAEEAIKAYHGHVLSAVARAHGKVNSALPTASAVGVVVAIGAGDDGSFVVVDAKFAQELHPGASMVRFSKAELDGMKKANDVMIDGERYDLLGQWVMVRKRIGLGWKSRRLSRQS